MAKWLTTIHWTVNIPHSEMLSFGHGKTCFIKYEILDEKFDEVTKFCNENQYEIKTSVPITRLEDGGSQVIACVLTLQKTEEIIEYKQIVDC